jgi:hypothetical protein
VGQVLYCGAISEHVDHHEQFSHSWLNLVLNPSGNEWHSDSCCVSGKLRLLWRNLPSDDRLTSDLPSRRLSMFPIVYLYARIEQSTITFSTGVLFFPEAMERVPMPVINALYDLQYCIDFCTTISYYYVCIVFDE